MSTPKIFQLGGYQLERGRAGVNQSLGWGDAASAYNPGSGDQIPWVDFPNNITVNSKEDDSIVGNAFPASPRITGYRVDSALKFYDRFKDLDRLHYWMFGYENETIPVVKFTGTFTGTAVALGDEFTDANGKEYHYLRSVYVKDVAGDLVQEHIFKNINDLCILDNNGTYTSGTITCTVYLTKEDGSTNTSVITQTYDTNKNTTLTALAAQIAALPQVDTCVYNSGAHTIMLKLFKGWHITNLTIAGHTGTVTFTNYFGAPASTGTMTHDATTFTFTATSGAMFEHFYELDKYDRRYREYTRLEQANHVSLSSPFVITDDGGTFTGSVTGISFTFIEYDITGTAHHSDTATAPYNTDKDTTLTDLATAIAAAMDHETDVDYDSVSHTITISMQDGYLVEGFIEGTLAGTITFSYSTDAPNKKNLMMTLAKRMELYDFRYPNSVCRSFTFNMATEDMCTFEANFLASKQELSSSAGGYGSDLWTLASTLDDNLYVPAHYQGILRLGTTQSDLVNICVLDASISVEMSLLQQQTTCSGLYISEPTISGKYAIDFKATISPHSVKTWQTYRNALTRVCAVVSFNYGFYSTEFFIKRATLITAGADDSDVANEAIEAKVSYCPINDDPFAAGLIYEHNQIHDSPLVMRVINDSSVVSMLEF